MYFGSVSFFKQIIYSTAICGAAAMAAFALMFGIKCSADSAETVETSKGSSKPKADTVDAGTLNVPDGTTISQVYLAMAAKGYTDEDIIKFFSDNGSPYLEEYVRERADRMISEKVNTDAPVYDSSYTINAGTADGSLYPDLYADSRADVFSSGEDAVYLTVSGFSADNIRDILGVLKAHGIRAVFFADKDADPQTLSDIAAGGHTIGVYCRNSGSGGDGSYIDDFRTAYLNIKDACGSAPVLFSLEEKGGSASFTAEMTRRGFVCCGSGVSAGCAPSEIADAISTAGQAVIGLDCTGIGGAEAEELITGIESEGFLFSDPISSPYNK